MMPTLTVVDDEPEMQQIIRHAAENAGFEVSARNSAKEFIESYPDKDPDVIVMDIVMPDMDGLELISWLGAQNCRASIVLISGYGEDYLRIGDLLGSHQGSNIVKTLTKPISLADLDTLLTGLARDSKTVVR